MRMLPALHGYPLRPWVGRGVVRVGGRRAGAGVAARQLRVAETGRGPQGYLDEFDPSALYDTLSDFPDLNVVLAEVQYPQAPWALALLRALPNLYMEISRFVSTDGVAKLLGIAGESRVLFGSRFPDSPLAAQLYHLHRYGLPESTLRALCGGNLDRLLGSYPPSPGAVRKAVKQTERARNLRREQTDAESALGQLRKKRLDGLKFRRQQPLGPFVVDFVSFELRLVVEVDGGHHDQSDIRARDDERTLWIERSGYLVLRFWNNEVLGNLEGVLERISEIAEQGRSPSPQPSPVEGEGEDHPHPSPLPSRERG